MTNDSFKFSGFFNVYKPKGQTSFSVTRYVTKLLKEIRAGQNPSGNPARRKPNHSSTKHKKRKFKVGHAGTLDPIAEGVLLVCFGSATRLIPYVHRYQKSYRAVFLLGCESDTDDTDHEIKPTGFAGVVERDVLLESLKKFRGEFEQVPPIYSAVKIDGRQAYQLAREGVDLQLSAKLVTVHELTLVRLEYPEVELQITCSSGTYIRSIARDLGKALGCGAVMSSLKRTAVGDFSADNAVPFLELTTENLHEHVFPSIQLVNHMPKKVCSAEEKELLINGRTIEAPAGLRYLPEEEIVAVDSEQHLFAILQYDEPGRLFLPTQVFIDEAS